MSRRLAEPLRSVLGGPSATALANGLGLHTVEDLLRHYPRRYDRRGELTDLAHLRDDEHVTVLAQVVKATSRPMKNRPGRILEVVVGDGTNTLSLTFFKQEWHRKRLLVGRRGLFAGKVGTYGRKRQLVHPTYVLLAGEDGLFAEDDGEDVADAAAWASELIPVYPATEKASSWDIAKAVRTVLDPLDLDERDDPLPADLRARRGLPGLVEALRGVHRPTGWAEVTRARERLRWEEAFVLQVELARRRAAQRDQPATARRARPDGLLAAFDAQLPFQLTRGQREVGEQIGADLAREFPMHRLLQGEVASGKTVVALRAMLTVVDSGGQAVLLAPTEVLAQQHHRSITALLGTLAEGGLLGGPEPGAAGGTRVALLTGSASTAARRRALLDAASGDAGIVVGTHALLQDPVDFFDLGLVVIDEQHRFGVEQRDALRAKAAKPPHVLVLTATPIPRTVAMTVFGDLEVSTLTELPQGRAQITTRVVPAGELPHWLDRAWERVREEVAAGSQAYVVCPRIGGDAGADTDPGTDTDTDTDTDPDPENDVMLFGDAAPGGGPAPAAPLAGAATAAPRRPPLAVLDVASLLSAGPLAGLTVAVLHGRLPPEAKDDVMRRFTAGEVDVLVATTVIEVGVDIANAGVMVVMDADRFGISQLHQLRGRVGRGGAPGLCLLVTDAPAGTPARDRLDAVAATSDGFALARLDLEQRREGDVLGAVQSGRRSSLRALAVPRDEDLIRAARDEASDLVEAGLDPAQLPGLACALAALVDQERAHYLEKG